MTTRFLLIRHADHDYVGRVLVGRRAGVHLNERGRRQAAELPARLAHERLDLLCCSPLERAVETAEPLARATGLEPRVCPDIVELDYGDWTDRAIADLLEGERWKQFHAARSCTRIPGGETLLEVQARIVGWIERIRAEVGEGTVALVSHGDVVRAGLAFYLGLPLDLMTRFEIGPASVSVLELSDWGPRILGLNLSP